MGNSPQKEPMKLPLVFSWGFVASLAVVGGMIWLFATYETTNWWWPAQEPKLSQEKWFEIVRNAVTTAAALGVGVTLFFSYRRQQTAEQTQRIGAQAQLTASNAQKTAAEALVLSNKQHDRDGERRKDEVTSELRSRYGKSAEQLGSSQLPVRLAGIYSLASLADDWAELDNVDERQVCIDLLGAYYKSLASSEFMEGVEECKSATLDVVKARISSGSAARKYWGQSRIRLENMGTLPDFNEVVLSEGGSLSLGAASLGVFSRMGGVELNGGRLIILDVLPGKGDLVISQSRLTGGSLLLYGKSVARDDYVDTTIRFQNVVFKGADVNVSFPGCRIVFQDCEFDGGNVILSGQMSSTTFTRCSFGADVFRRRRQASLLGGRPFLSHEVIVEDCTYAPGVPELEPQPVS